MKMSLELVTQKTMFVYSPLESFKKKRKKLYFTYRQNLNVTDITSP